MCAHLAGMDVAGLRQAERGLGNTTLTTIVQVANRLEPTPASGWRVSPASDSASRRAHALYTATEFLEARREHSDRSRASRTPLRERRLR